MPLADCVGPEFMLIPDSIISFLNRAIRDLSDRRLNACQASMMHAIEGLQSLKSRDPLSAEVTGLLEQAEEGCSNGNIGQVATNLVAAKQKLEAIWPKEVLRHGT